jgi:hypothetical protein
MDLSDILQKAGIDPKQTCVMRHTKKGFKPFDKPFRQLLEEWAHDKPDGYNAYQRGQRESGSAGATLKKSQYLASFVGDEHDRANFVGLYRVGEVQKIPLKKFLQLAENRPLVEIGYPFRSDPPFRLWFDLTRLKGFDHLKLKVVIKWPEPMVRWCRWAHKSTFRIIEGAELVRSLNARKVRRPADKIPSSPGMNLLLEHAYPRASPAMLRIITPRHKVLSNRFREWLKSAHEIEARQEVNRVDVHFEYGGRTALAELKICEGLNATQSIREALGQILEYNHYPGRKPSDMWLIVLDGPANADDRRFIKSLRENLSLPLSIGWKTKGGFSFYPTWPRP